MKRIFLNEYDPLDFFKSGEYADRYVIVIFQPELRKVLEQLGQKRIMASLIPFDAGKEGRNGFTDKTISELVKACVLIWRSRRSGR